MGTPHKHSEIIKAWADGADIEYKEDGHWFLIDKPTWQGATEYRVRITPAPKREPLTVHVYSYDNGTIWLSSQGDLVKCGDYLGEFVLTPKEQT